MRKLEEPCIFIGNLKVLPESGRVQCGKNIQHVEPKALQVLLLLAEHAEQIVSRNKILQNIWPNSPSGDQALNRAISNLRKILTECNESPHIIETVPGHGYRLLAECQASSVTYRVSAAEGIPWRNKFSRNGIGLKISLAVSIAVALSVTFFLVLRSDDPPIQHFKVIAGPTFLTYLAPTVFPVGNPELEDVARAVTQALSDGMRENGLATLMDEHEVANDFLSAAVIQKLNSEFAVKLVLGAEVRPLHTEAIVRLYILDIATGSVTWHRSIDYQTHEDPALLSKQVAELLASEAAELLKSDARDLQSEDLDARSDIDPKALGLFYRVEQLRENEPPRYLAEAFQLLTEALEIQPDFADAWLALGRYQRCCSEKDKRQAAKDARESFFRALEFDPENGRAHAILAGLAMFEEYNWTAAENHIEKALELAPNDEIVLANAGWFCVNVGRTSEAVKHGDTALLENPTRRPVTSFYAWWLIYDNQLERALSFLRFHSAFYEAERNWITAYIRLLQGNLEGALSNLDESSSKMGHLWISSMVHHAMGNSEASDEALEALIEKYQNGWAFQIAIAYAFRNQPDEAFYWLEESYNQRDTGLPQLRVHREFEYLHNDPRWKMILTKLNFSN